MEKLYERQYFSNEQSPDLNGDNLNKIDEALDGVDNRILEMHTKVFSAMEEENRRIENESQRQEAEERREQTARLFDDTLEQIQEIVQNMQNAIDNEHSHANKAVLDKLSEDSNGNPRYNNSPIGSGGGAGGTMDYEALENKPSINGHELSGNQSFANLGLDLSTYQIKTGDVKDNIVTFSGGIPAIGGIPSFMDHGDIISGSSMANIMLLLNEWIKNIRYLRDIMNIKYNPETDFIEFFSNGEWRNFRKAGGQKLYLYNNGIFNTSYANDFLISNYYFNEESMQILSVSGFNTYTSRVIHELYCELIYTGGGAWAQCSGSIIFPAKIDVTDYEFFKIKISYKTTSKASYGRNAYTYLTRDYTKDVPDVYEQCMEIKSIQSDFITVIISLNVSNLIGEFYPVIVDTRCRPYHANIYIHEIWLE